MSTVLESVLRTLHQKHRSIGAIEIADAAWLAAALPMSSELVPNASRDEDNDVESGTDGPRTLTENDRDATDPRFSHEESRLADDPSGDVLGRGGGAGLNVPGQSIALPKAPALPNSLQIERALRPMARKVASRLSKTVDEERTAELIAETRCVNVVEVPQQERWLDGVLVLERSPTMRFWQEPLAEFQRLLWRVGAFRSLDVYYLNSFTSTPQLFADRHMRVKRPNRAFITGSKRQAVFLCSDCRSNAWLSGETPKLLEDWRRACSTTVIQMLDTAVWRQTALREATFCLGRNHSSLGEFTVSLQPSRKHQSAFQPIVSLEPESLKRLSPILLGQSENQLTCFRAEESAQQTIQQPSNWEPTGLAGDAAFKRFAKFASPSTLKLARSLACMPLFLPVMRLVQHCMHPETGHSHLSEIFNSGMLYRLKNEKDEKSINDADDPNTIEYDFLPRVREHLLDQSSFWRVTECIELLDRYLQSRFGQARNFTAILRDPSSVKEWVSAEISDNQRSFARVTSQVLRRLGQEYQQAAEDLEKVASGRRVIHIKVSNQLEMTQTASQLVIPYPLADMELEDGTNVRKGTKYIERPDRWPADLYFPVKAQGVVGWENRLFDLRNLFSRIANEEDPISCRIAQTTGPGVPTDDKHAEWLPDDAEKLVTFKGGGGLSREFCFIDGPNREWLDAAFAFRDANGNPMQNTAGQAYSARLRLSRFTYLYRVKSSRHGNQAFVNACEQGASALYELPAKISSRIWRNWKQGFSRRENSDEYLWLNTLFEIGWQKDLPKFLELSRFALDESSERVELPTGALFPRLPSTISREQANGIPNLAGYPGQWYSEITNVAKYSIRAIEFLLESQTDMQDNNFRFAEQPYDFFIAYGRKDAESLSRLIVDGLIRENYSAKAGRKLEQSSNVSALAEELLSIAEKVLIVVTTAMLGSKWVVPALTTMLTDSTDARIRLLIVGNRQETFIDDLPEIVKQNAFGCARLDEHITDMLIARVSAEYDEGHRERVDRAHRLCNELEIDDPKSQRLISVFETTHDELSLRLQPEEDERRVRLQLVQSGLNLVRATHSRNFQARIFAIAVQDAEYFDDRNSIAFFVREQARLQMEFGEFENSLMMLRNARTLFEIRNSRESYVTRLDIAKCLLETAQLGEAYSEALKVAKLFEDFGDDQNFAAAFLIAGDSQIRLNEYAKAVPYLRKASEISERIDDSQSDLKSSALLLAASRGVEEQARKENDRNAFVMKAFDVLYRRFSEGSSYVNIGWGTAVATIDLISNSEFTCYFDLKGERICRCAVWVDQNRSGDHEIFYAEGETLDEGKNSSSEYLRVVDNFGSFALRGVVGGFTGHPISNASPQEAGDVLWNRFVTPLSAFLARSEAANSPEYASIIAWISEFDEEAFDKIGSALGAVALLSGKTRRVNASTLVAWAIETDREQLLWKLLFPAVYKDDEGSVGHPNREFDVFISHVPEDKATIVRPLVEALSDAGMKCWVDEAEIAKGDRLSEKIKEALSIATFTLVVLSENYLNAKWAQSELLASFTTAAEVRRTNVLPLFVAERSFVLKQLPLLSVVKGISWTGDASRVVTEVSRLLDVHKTLDSAVAQADQLSGGQTRVFISYSHDTPRHANRVLDLSNRLREWGIDCHIDQYAPSPSEGWPIWMEKQIEQADFVLCVCTERFHDRFTSDDNGDAGRGVAWEANLIRNEIYHGKRRGKFVPVVFADGSEKFIPAILRAVTSFRIDRFDLKDDEFLRLYRFLAD